MTVFRLALLACLPALLGAETAQSLFYSKSFPGSRPEYFEVLLQENGKIEYREAPGEDNPVLLELSPAETNAIFLLATRLEFFKRTLESGLSVARMGEKTFRWTNGSETREQKFNYSTDPMAGALLEWFERIGESALYLIELERTARYDRLGVNKILLQIESAWDRNRLVSARQFLPFLDRIAKNGSYLNMARERAAKLAEAFRNPGVNPIPEPEKKAQ